MEWVAFRHVAPIPRRPLGAGEPSLRDARQSAFRPRTVKGYSAVDSVATDPPPPPALPAPAVQQPQPKRRGAIAAFVAALALLAVTEYLDHRSTNEQRETSRSVAHTHEVLEQLDGLLLSLLDAESARRAYALTGDEKLLGPSRSAAVRATRGVEDLRVLTADNPKQQKRIDDLETKVKARLAALDTAIADRHKGLDLEVEAKNTHAGNALMTAARDVIDDMIDEERALLAQREQATAASVDRTRTFQTLGTIVSVGLLFLAIYGLRREIRRREEVEAVLRENEAELHQANTFLDSLIDNIPDMIFVKEAKDLSFVLFNKAGEDLVGMKRDEMIGKSDFDFFPEEEAEAFVAKDRETLAAKTIVDIPEEPLTTEGGTRWLHTKKVPVLDEKGEPAFLLGISEDITERRLAQEELREARDRAELANRELESFSYSVAHDLRAPLRSIDGFAQALLEDNAKELNEEGKSHLGRVRAAPVRMGELIDDLLLLARTSRAEVVRTKVDVTALATEIGEALKAAKYEKTTLVVEKGLTTEADSRLLRILLENLLSNAFKFSRAAEAPKVEVGLRKGGESGDEEAEAQAFFVKDNGAGLDLASAKKLFSAFQRYHKPTEFEGTGIGLATAERIVSRHGGRIWAESAPGKGATFFFIL